MVDVKIVQDEEVGAGVVAGVLLVILVVGVDNQKEEVA